MKIGVAVPCYYGHIQILYDLLESIEKQTIFPDKVVVSISSTSVFKYNKEYSFKLEVIVTEDNKLAAENRNIASSQLLDMDYITFIDADDLMHPQRIEFLLKCFQECDCDIILHNYFDEGGVPFSEKIFEPYQELLFMTNTLTQCQSGCIRHFNGSYQGTYKIHHAQVSIKREILDKVKFPEETEYNRKADCVFCYRIFSLPNIKHAYIQNELSYYKASNTCMDFLNN